MKKINKKARASKFIVGSGLIAAVVGTNHVRDQRMRDIFDCFNEACQIEYASDLDEQGNLIDYWQTPFETRTRGKGDCEDFAFYLQDLLARRGIVSNVRFGMVSPMMPGGHAWNEIRIKGRDYIFDASNGIIVERKNPMAYPHAGEPLKVEPWKSCYEDYCNRRVNEVVKPVKPYLQRVKDKGRKWMHRIRSKL